MNKRFFYIVIILFAGLLCNSCDKENGIDSNNPNNNGITISLDKTEIVLEIGGNERLVAIFNPIDTPNQAHVWSTSNPKIATIDETGNVTGVGIGSATITVKALNGGSTSKCTVTVIEKIIPVQSISFDINSYEMFEEDQLTIQYTIKPSNATNKNVELSSSDNTVAIVSADGIVTAISAGETTITAKTEDGEKSATCKIKVLARDVKVSEPEVSNIKSTSAMVTGNITVSGMTITERGICWSTQMNPTIDNNSVKMTGGEISYVLRDLTPITTYYVRLYAVVDGVVKYGNQVPFETLNIVDFDGLKILDITAHTAVVSGKIYDNGSTIEDCGIVYSIDSSPTIDDNKISISNTSIYYSLYELEANAKYIVRLYATIDKQIYYSNDVEFTTNEELITNFKVTEYYEDKLVLETEIPRGYESVDICYGTNPNPTITDHTTTQKINGGILKLTLSGLSKGTTYYIRAYERIGGKVEYFDNEFSAETLGGIYYLEILDRKTSKDWYDTYFMLRCILPEGTYELIPSSPGATGYVRVKKEGGIYQSSTYIDHNTPSFIIYLHNNPIYEVCRTPIYLHCTNIETNVKYTFFVDPRSFSFWYTGILDY